MERYCAYEGQPVLLKCPYRRGPIGEYYSIQWLDVAGILLTLDVDFNNITFDAVVSNANPDYDYACELTLSAICNATNPNCNSITRHGPAIEVTTYSEFNKSITHY